MKELNIMKFKTTDDKDLFEYHAEYIPFLSYRCLDETGIVRNAFTLRRTAEDRDVKLFWHPGEDADEVAAFSAVLMTQLGTEAANRVSAQQKHTANVYAVTEEDIGKSLPVSHIENTDALVTNLPGVCLTISVADCIPLLFVDPVHRAIGIAHSGRKGTMQRIGEKTVQTMQKLYDSDPAEILAAIGPGICADCYEVGDEIWDEFEKEWGSVRTRAVFEKKNGKYRLDLWEANRIVLREAKLLSEHITVTNLCNRCNSSHFYSFRADGRIINQIAACLMLRK